MSYELLVVEDSDDDFDALERTCRRVGFRGSLRRFTDGESALAHMRSLDWDSPGKEDLPAIIILDLNLPGMDGRELLVELKGDPVLRVVPVVIYTTSGAAADVASCYLHHANAYQVKPMDVAQLEADIRKMLDYWLSTRLLTA